MINCRQFLTKSNKLSLNFIGLGKMGNTICNNLIHKDYSLLGYDPYTTQDVKIKTTNNLLDFTKNQSIIFSSLLIAEFKLISKLTFKLLLFSIKQSYKFFIDFLAAYPTLPFLVFNRSYSNCLSSCQSQSSTCGTLSD